MEEDGEGLLYKIQQPSPGRRGKLDMVPGCSGHGWNMFDTSTAATQKMIVIRSKKWVRQSSPTQNTNIKSSCHMWNKILTELPRYPCIAPLHPRNGAAPQAPTDEDEAAVSAGGLNWVLYVLFRRVSNGFRMVWNNCEQFRRFYSHQTRIWSQLGLETALEAIPSEHDWKSSKNHNSLKIPSLSHFVQVSAALSNLQGLLALAPSANK